MSLKFDKNLKIRLRKSLKIYFSFVFRKKVFNSASKKKVVLGCLKVETDTGILSESDLGQVFKDKKSNVVQEKKLNQVWYLAQPDSMMGSGA